MFLTKQSTLLWKDSVTSTVSHSTSDVTPRTLDCFQNNLSLLLVLGVYIDFLPLTQLN